MQRIGVFGGSFDPIHYGHLALAEAVCECLDLDQMLFVPTGQQPLKNAHRGWAEQRLRMVELAVEGNPLFKVCDLEVRRSGPSYSVETVYTLQTESPGNRWWFVTGADALMSLPRWHHIEDLARVVRFAAVARPGFVLDMAALLNQVPLLEVDVCEAPLLDVTSTMLRERAGRGLSLRYLVPDAVRSYILAEGLYL